MIDTTTLAKLSSKQGIDDYTILREYVQVRFLDEFYRLAPPHSVYFKGGTAIRFLFGSERFSEDLDFTLSGSSSHIARFVTRVTSALTAEFPELVSKELKTITGYSFRLALPGPSTRHPLTVRLDFSMRESVMTPQASPIRTALPVTVTTLVEHVSKPEILAEKIRAIINRRKGRDIYDLWYLLHTGTPVEEALVQQKFSYYRETFDPRKLFSSIGSWGEKSLYDDIAKFLPRSRRPIIRELGRLTLDLLAETRVIQ